MPPPRHPEKAERRHPVIPERPKALSGIQWSVQGNKDWVPVPDKPYGFSGMTFPGFANPG
jgi:hypothetical protein